MVVSNRKRKCQIYSGKGKTDRVWSDKQEAGYKELNQNFAVEEVNKEEEEKKK